MEERCDNCRFWDSNITSCRRYPPVFHARDIEPGEVKNSGLSSAAGFWPETMVDDWCGEWKPRPEVTT